MLNAIDNANGYQQAYDYNDIDDIEQEKRSLAALARNGLLQTNGKRNVAAVARLGLMHPTLAENMKRSLATLAKNGQLPSREPEADDLSESQWSEYKRNIGSLARSGHIAAGKRNIAALARDYVLPSTGKRNLPSILRSGGGSNGSQQQTPKRNVAALARDNLYPIYQNRNAKRDVSAAAHNTRTTHRHLQALVPFILILIHLKNILYIRTESAPSEKRNVGSLKNSRMHGTTKVKRDISYDNIPDEAEIVAPVYQTEPLNYEELYEAMNELYPNYDSFGDIQNDKRFLGKIERDGCTLTSTHSTCTRSSHLNALDTERIIMN